MTISILLQEAVLEGLLRVCFFSHETANCAKYSIQQAFELYTEKGESIFKSSLWERITNPLVFFDEKLSEEGLEKVLLNFFGDLSLKDFIKPCVITSYDMETRQAKLSTPLKHETQKPRIFLYVIFAGQLLRHLPILSQQG
ncbi:patatin-like phospholipase/acyl hydrolase [Chryseobacterium ginsenosidimutans]|uniref:hypothetical protein n=1 Tax=Chryseobacterium ginsenosidimutans TaxID=687846 RepID=UPI0027870ED3|nr:hypothetical protein [Chryseobacterium ginsenosidimutans]MDQ0593191.1 patatin-like phospholipase/acyl hydrolase [Chryseobacterium ginsenosidimutans]